MMSSQFETLNYDFVIYWNAKQATQQVTPKLVYIVQFLPTLSKKRGMTIKN